MSNAEAGLRILAASASIQWSVADMLEAKADEMETLREWLIHTLRASEFESPEAMIHHSCSFHAVLLEMLGGVTKIEQGLAQHLELLLVEEEGIGSPLGDWMGAGTLP